MRLIVGVIVCDAETLLDCEQRKPTQDLDALGDCDGTPVIFVMDAVRVLEIDGVLLAIRVRDMDGELLAIRVRDMDGELLAIRVIVRLFDKVIEPDTDSEGD